MGQLLETEVRRLDRCLRPRRRRAHRAAVGGAAEGEADRNVCATRSLLGASGLDGRGRPSSIIFLGGNLAWMGLWVTVGVDLLVSQRVGGWLLHSRIMAVVTEETPAAGADKVHSLVQLLRTRSYEEIRQRMYDNPPGSPWWSACKTELDIRNGEQMAAALTATSHVLEKLRGSTQHFEQLAETLHESTKEVLEMLTGTKEAGRRLEIAVYVTIGITLVQLFNLIFEVFRKR